jgi:hypothetical protein
VVMMKERHELFHEYLSKRITKVGPQQLLVLESVARAIRTKIRINGIRIRATCRTPEEKNAPTGNCKDRQQICSCVWCRNNYTQLALNICSGSIKKKYTNIIIVIM